MLDLRICLIDSTVRKVRKRPVCRNYPYRAVNLHDVPEKTTIDKSVANTAAIESIKDDACVDIVMRQNKYINNIVEQVHRAAGPSSAMRPSPSNRAAW